MWILHFGLTGLFVLLGILFLCGKGGVLFAGLNASSKEERTKYNKRRLFRSVGILMLLLAVFVVMLHIGIELGESVLTVAAAILMTIFPIVLVVHVNTSKYYKAEPEGPPKEGGKND